jgi:hypothetical protein
MAHASKMKTNNPIDSNTRHISARAMRASLWRPSRGLRSIITPALNSTATMAISTITITIFTQPAYRAACPGAAR